MLCNRDPAQALRHPAGRAVGFAILGAITVAGLFGAGAPARAAPTVSSGPSYVQVPNSPFSVGGNLDGLAFDPAAGAIAAGDYAGGKVPMLSLTATTGGLSAVSGSPFTAGRGTDAVATSPSGGLLAATNLVDDTVSVYKVSAGGALAPVAGSPFQTGAAPRAVAFSAAGNLLAVANETDDTVSVYTVAANGTLSAVSGSPFQTGSEPVAVSFAPAGNLLAVANEGAGSVSVFTVSPADGRLTPSAGSPLTVGDGPSALAFNASGSLLAVADSSSSAVSVFTTGNDAVNFTAVSGSPFPTGQDPLSVAFNQGGTLLATADFLDNTVAVFNVGGGGALSLAQGAPFTVGSGPHGVLFVPNTSLIAVADATDGTVSVLQPTPPPSVAVTVPAAGQSYTLGSTVQTSFACTDNSTTGIASCVDAHGSASPGLLDTSTLGTHTYTVNATSVDGLTASASVTYTVVPAPPTNTVQPALAGHVDVGRTLRCSSGRWSGHPTSYTYQWERGGLALSGANHRTYRITQLDRGSALDCVVTANDGTTAQAASKSIVVPLNASSACPGPTGRLAGATLGQFKLGEARAQALSGNTVISGSAYRDELCLTPAGVQLGFPTRSLSRALKSTALRGRVVWVLTANPGYRYGGVAAGVQLASAEQRLGSGILHQRGAATFYLVRGTASTVVLVGRGGVVRQVGIASNRATATPAAVAALVASLPG